MDGMRWNAYHKKTPPGSLANHTVLQSQASRVHLARRPWQHAHSLAAIQFPGLWSSTRGKQRGNKQRGLSSHVVVIYTFAASTDITKSDNQAYKTGTRRERYLI